MGKNTGSKVKAMGFLFRMCLFVISGMFLVSPDLSVAEDSLCAAVQIEIKQELTLERQAFDAHMVINNGISHITLEDVLVEVTFTDEAGYAVLATSDPDNTGASFFILDDSPGITDNGDGTWSILPVGPSSSSDLHWMIIPAPGASNGIASGTLYYVGAKLTYTIGGEENEIEVNPDFIYVKPMPELNLDYFIPMEVYGDDAFTREIEAPVPFSLGVRVHNSGYGTAKDLKIDSAQPKIVENELGLTTGFVIQGSTVNGQEATDSLLVDFGNIEPDTAGVSRWIMTCSLSGKFVKFDAEFSHSDELGGELTSLINSVETHLLVQDVLVDIAGRDTLCDFLAKDDSVYRVYESDTLDTEAADQSGSSSLQFDGDSGSESNYTLTTAQTSGFIFIKLPDPLSGRKVVKQAVRSDGKQIKEENIWLSKTRNENNSWDHFVNLFDTDPTGSYAITFEESPDAPQPPVLMLIPTQTRIEGEHLSFMIQALDPNGTIPELSASPLPVGADFTNQGDGTGFFDWPTTLGQSGDYTINFTASDPELSSSQRVLIRIFSVYDTDGDGMDDAWEMSYFGTKDRDGTGDFDSDDMSDLDEFLNEKDPTISDNVPTDPEIQSPAPDEEVAVTSPDLTIENSTIPDGSPINYEFDVFTDPQMTDLVASRHDVAQASVRASWPVLATLGDSLLMLAIVADLPPAEPVETTSWTVPESLDENRFYYWRVRSTIDETGSSLWVYSTFFVNTENDPPGQFTTSAPQNDISVTTLTPSLEITNSLDLDQDEITYTFEVYEDAGMTILAALSPDIPEGPDGSTSWTVTTELSDNTPYFWRAIATDEDGAQTETALAPFSVQTSNTTPDPPAISFPEIDSEVRIPNPELTIANGFDADGDTLAYYFELDKVNTFDSPAKQTSPEIAEGSGFTSWQVSGFDEDCTYFWRVKAYDGASESQWTRGSFFINTINDFPSVPTLKNPGENTWVDTRTPVLSVNPCIDPDKDVISYKFKIYSNDTLTRLVKEIESPDPETLLDFNLSNCTRYYWRARSEDHHGLVSDWMEPASFVVKLNINEPPEVTITQPFADVSTNQDTILIEWQDTDVDNNASISLYYDTDATGEDGTLIADSIQEDPDEIDDLLFWDISGLEGVFYIYALIEDEDSSATHYGPAAITIDRTLPVVQASPQGGVYTDPKVVELTLSEPATIYYTLDGTNPLTSSSVYQSPLTIASDTTLKFMAIDPASNQSAIETRVYTIGEPENLEVTVTTSQGAPLSSLKVYAFTESGACTGTYDVTDENGTALFDPDSFAPGSYKFRADYLGSRFWTNPIPIPGTGSLNLTIQVETVEVTITTAAGAIQGVKVYLFSESGSYLGIYLITDENGQISLELPTGISFKFRSDILGGRYWSDATEITGGAVNSIPVNAGGGLLAITVQEDKETPMENVKVFLLSRAGKYLGKNSVTDPSGMVFFDVPEGNYKVRADYLGNQFYRADTLVDQDTDLDFTIPHKDATITVNRVFSSPEPISGIKAYLFTASGRYTGQHRITDENGMVIFHVPEKAYKIRADYRNRQFWSKKFIQQDTTIEIPMADAVVTVGWGSFTLPDVSVYAFTLSGLYLGISETTDAQGQAVFRLPAGTYKFRADYQTSRFWSPDETLVQYTENPIDITTGGGSFVLTVLENQTDPLVGVNSHVFNEQGTYFGVYGPTSSDGEVTFDLADGEYDIRIDYLGYQFWTGLYTIADILSDTFIIRHHTATITVNGVFDSESLPLEGVDVYLFTSDEAYQNQSRVTDENGRTSFYLPDREYKVRVDYLNQQHWSDQFTGTNVTVDIPMADAEITVTGSGLTQPDIPVYVFSASGQYLGISETTDSNGIITFYLPAGTYKFRADYQNSQYWSDEQTLIPDQMNPVTIETGGGLFTFTVLKNETDPLAGVPCYLFNESGLYLGIYKTTSSEGQVSFDLANGTYKFRVDHLGYQFFSPVYAVPDTLSEVFTITHQDVTITVDTEFQGETDPMEGLKVYLFKPSGSYLGQYQFTDENGHAVFSLPDQAYKVQVDYLNIQFWSDDFIQQDATVDIEMADARITVTNKRHTKANVQVYVFSPTDAYLGINNTTDKNGEVTFNLPAETFKFRADYHGSQYWSDEETLIPDQVNDYEISACKKNLRPHNRVPGRAHLPNF